MQNTINLDMDNSIPIAATADVVVVGGGPAGIGAAVAAARAGVNVILLERYPYLGGLASGGMVLILDDMINGKEITVRGINSEMIDRMTKLDLCIVPPEPDRESSPEMWRKWSRWGVFDFNSRNKPQDICYAAAFDPDAYKRVANDLIREAGVNLRLHSWFSRAIVKDGTVVGVVCESKAGRHAVMGKVVIDTSGDLDVAASAGAQFSQDKFLVTTVFRLGGVDTEAAERFEYEEPEAFHTLDREAKRIIGGCWDKWWLKTPLPGIVWCNCPHMPDIDALKVEDLTAADFRGRERMHALIAFARERMPGFEKAFLVDVAPQLGVRQSRLLEGAYIVTKEDVTGRRHFHDTVARGRDYYYPYRAFLPRNVDQLLVAGRHYSATAAAQRMSREIPPCMASGQAVGVAAAVSIDSGSSVAAVDISAVRKILSAQGHDTGETPAENAVEKEEAA